MEAAVQRSLESWVAFLSHAEIPILKRTARDLVALHEDPDNISAGGVAAIIAIDPMMTVKLLRYLQHHKHFKQQHEVVEVEQALLMTGIEPLFRNVPLAPSVNDTLAGQMDALVNLLRVVRRAHRASAYALAWAVHLRDLRFEEVRIAALLHDLAEILMWCFASNEMLQIDAARKKDRTLRSGTAQRQVLGFALNDLQLALAREWELPKLLLTLMDEKCAKHTRVRIVLLAVDLARHSSFGWDDAGLPEDYRRIGDLLGMAPEKVMAMIGAGTSEETGRASRHP